MLALATTLQKFMSEILDLLSCIAHEAYMTRCTMPGKCDTDWDNLPGLFSDFLVVLLDSQDILNIFYGQLRLIFLCSTSQ